MTIGGLLGLIGEPEYYQVLPESITNGSLALPVANKTQWYEEIAPVGWTASYAAIHYCHSFYAGFFPQWFGSVVDVSQCVVLPVSWMEQTVTGLQTGVAYTLSFRAASRADSAAVRLVITANGALIYDSGERAKSNFLDYTAVSFTPTNSTQTIRFECQIITTSGSILLADISLRQKQYITNANFESPFIPSNSGFASSEPPGWMGVMEVVKSHGYGSWYPYWEGCVDQVSQCVDFGSGAVTTLSQTLSGLVVGKVYTLTYFASSRTSYPADTILVVSLGGTVLKNHGVVPRQNLLTKHTLQWCATFTTGDLVFEVSQVASYGNIVLASITFRGP